MMLCGLTTTLIDPLGPVLGLWLQQMANVYAEAILFFLML